MQKLLSITFLALLSLPAFAQDVLPKLSAPAEGSATASTQKPDNPDAQPVEKPLPEVRQLLLDVERNEKSAEAIQNTYTYHVHTEEQELSKDGSVKKNTVRDADSFAIDGVRVNRTTAIDGRPLSANDAKKEEERIDKDVQKARDKRAKEQGKGRDTDVRGNDVITVARILELGKFSNPRRQMLEGRATIVVDYTGDADAKTKSSAEGIIRNLAGTVWIDEQDRALVRGEGHFANDFKIGAGLVADIHKGLTFSFRTTKVNGEAWLPAEIDGRGSARVMLFLSFNGALSLKTSDYKKFRSSAEIVQGSGTTIAPKDDVPDSSSSPTPK